MLSTEQLLETAARDGSIEMLVACIHVSLLPLTLSKRRMAPSAGNGLEEVT